MPNILTNRERHRRCQQPNHGPWDEWGDVGDVRRCEHGRIQEAYEVRGVVPPYWMDLSPFWTPIRYWRARRALS